MQFAPATSPRLFLKQPRFGLMHQWMRFQALTPVEHVPIVRTSRSLDLNVPLDGGFAMHSQFCAGGGRKHPLALLHLMPVSLRHPLGSFVGMSAPCPTAKLCPPTGETSVKFLCSPPSFL